MSSCVFVILWEPQVQVCLGCFHLFFSVQLLSGWRPVGDSPAGLATGWYARLALRAVCAAACQESGERSAHLWQPCLLWHLGCCLLQQHIFHPHHQACHLSPIPLSTTPSSQLHAFVRVAPLRHWQLWDERLLILAMRSIRKYPKRAAPYSLSAILFLFPQVSARLHQKCELWGATASLLLFLLTRFNHHMHDFLSIFQLIGFRICWGKKGDTFSFWCCCSTH